MKVICSSPFPPSVPMDLDVKMKAVMLGATFLIVSSTVIVYTADSLEYKVTKSLEIRFSMHLHLHDLK